MNKEFDDFLKQNGIERRLTVPFSSASNRISERKNRSLVETARCLLSQSNFDLKMWAEAINTANYL